MFPLRVTVCRKNDDDVTMRWQCGTFRDISSPIEIFYDVLIEIHSDCNVMIVADHKESKYWPRVREHGSTQRM